MVMKKRGFLVHVAYVWRLNCLLAAAALFSIDSFFYLRRHQMNTFIVSDDLKFTSQATYQIFIKGFLDESWSDRLNGMTIGHLNSDAGLPVTKLWGKVQDQAELLGVMNSIYEMHLPLISLELIEDFEAES
jgi:hypothetical protein